MKVLEIIQLTINLGTNQLEAIIIAPTSIFQHFLKNECDKSLIWNKRNKIILIKSLLSYHVTSNCRFANERFT